MNPHLQRAGVLMQQERWELAEEQIRLSLAGEPDDSHAHALLALCLLEREKLDGAEAEARQAIHLGPDIDFAHYVHARVLYDRNRHGEALQAIGQAIQLDPTDADYHSLRAAIEFDEKNWEASLASAETGLQFDPEHTGCNNLRAMALVKLGRRAEAGATIDATLQRNPDNAVTHANRGWTLLEGGDRKKALEHFKESLRLDPTSDWARAGIVEALKAGNPLYALMLRYFFWMARLSGRAQWVVILGGYFGSRLLGSMSRSNPELRPWIMPIQIAYVTFALLTWLADPICNLLLRLNRYGRLALSEEQLAASNWVGGCLLLSLLGLPLWVLGNYAFQYLVASLVFFGLSLPIASVWRCQKGWPRVTMTAFATAMALLGGGAILAVFFDAADLGVSLLTFFGLGFIASQWIVNGLALVRPKR